MKVCLSKGKTGRQSNILKESNKSEREKEALLNAFKVGTFIAANPLKSDWKCLKNENDYKKTYVARDQAMKITFKSQQQKYMLSNAMSSVNRDLALRPNKPTCQFLHQMQSWTALPQVVEAALVPHRKHRSHRHGFITSFTRVSSNLQSHFPTLIDMRWILCFSLALVTLDLGLGATIPVSEKAQESSRSGRISKEETPLQTLDKVIKETTGESAGTLVKTALKRRMGRFLFDLFDGGDDTPSYSAPAIENPLAKLFEFNIDTDTVMRVRATFYLIKKSRDKSLFSSCT